MVVDKCEGKIVWLNTASASLAKSTNCWIDLTRRDYTSKPILATISDSTIHDAAKRILLPDKCFCLSPWPHPTSLISRLPQTKSMSRLLSLQPPSETFKARRHARRFNISRPETAGSCPSERLLVDCAADPGCRGFAIHVLWSRNIPESVSVPYIWKRR